MPKVILHWFHDHRCFMIFMTERPGIRKTASKIPVPDDKVGTKTCPHTPSTFVESWILDLGHHHWDYHVWSCHFGVILGPRCETTMGPPEGPPCRRRVLRTMSNLATPCVSTRFWWKYWFFMAGDVIYETFSRVLTFHKNRFSWTLRIIVRMHPGSSRIILNDS